MSNPLRTSLALLAALAVALPALALALPALAEDGAPLQLGQEHLGMTSEDIVQVEQAAETEHVVEQAIEKSEWTSDDLADEAPGCICPVCEQPAADATVGTVVTKAEGVDDYASCVEVAIRSGNGFKAASSVCQALFPEAPSATPPTE